MILPNADKAVIPIEKLLDYCLNPFHKEGKHKAKVFASSLDLDSSNAGFLHGQILKKIKSHDAIYIQTNQFGKHYFVDFPFEFRDRTAEIRTKWTIRNKEDFPRLTSCYVKRKAKLS